MHELTPKQLVQPGLEAAERHFDASGLPSARMVEKGEQAVARVAESLLEPGQTAVELHQPLVELRRGAVSNRSDRLAEVRDLGLPPSDSGLKSFEVLPRLRAELASLCSRDLTSSRLDPGPKFRHALFDALELADHAPDFGDGARVHT